MWEDTEWKEKQKNLDDHLDVEPTEDVKTPAPTPTPITTTAATTEVKITTPSKPNESGQNSMILEDKLPGLPKGFNLRDHLFG